MTSGMHLMAKPVGPLCNLDCGYCFYLEKESLFPAKHRFRMSDEVLEAYVGRYIAAQPTPEVEFTWQGGEPTLMGLEFFRRAVALQRLHGGGKTIRNTLQTNGTLLDDEWGAFLRGENFLVGLSIDGPRDLHDQGRPDKQGRGSFDAVLRGIEVLKRHQVPFNALVTVSRAVSARPLEVYRFLKEQGVGFIQFNPVVERLPSAADRGDGLDHKRPPALSRDEGEPDAEAMVTPHSVEPGAYGAFLIAIFDEWVRHDVGRIHVMNFDWALASWCGLPASVCLFAERCGKAAIVEQDGGVYSCDHFMYPEYRLGSILSDEPAELLASPAQTAFGDAKQETLPRMCRRCPYLFACHGECPKNRFAVTPEGEAGLNYLCPSYKAYFGHITPAMNAMAKLVSHGQPAALVMDAFKGPLAIALTDNPLGEPL